MVDDGLPRLMGVRLPRVEDSHLLRGRGRYVDDIKIPGTLHASFFRSSVAHARIRNLDVSAARNLRGVRAIFTYHELRPLLTLDRIPLALPSAAIRFDVDPTCLALEEVCYVGEPIVLIVAESRRIAEDAAELIEIEYEQLPAVVDPVEGLVAGAPRARSDCPDNLVARTAIRYGDVEAAFAKAAYRI